MKNARSIIVGICLLAAALIGGTLPAASQEPAILTISGAIENHNRGASSEDDATMLGKNALEFDKGLALDRAALAELPQITYDAPIPGTETIVQFSGPLLTDVLALAGATGETAFLTALDGYGVEMDLGYITEHKPIIAIDVTGASMAIGDLGPTVSVFPPSDDAELADAFAARQIWALYHIGVE